MNEFEWVARCSARLHVQWPRVCREDRDDAARQLGKGHKWVAQRWLCEPKDLARTKRALSEASKFGDSYRHNM